MSKDLQRLQIDADQWHQPNKSKKTQFIVFTHIVNHPKLSLSYENSLLEQTRVFKYLGYLLDPRLSFKPMVD
jgi:hypothetical protein